MKETKLENSWAGKCFGCAPDNEGGLKMEFWIAGDVCRSHYRVPAHMCGYDGIAHGGVIALMLDEIAQWTLIGLLGKMGMTRDLSVRYLRPVRTQTELVVEGRVLEHDGRTVRLGLALLDAEGRRLAEGESSYALAELSRIAEITGTNEQALIDFLEGVRPAK